MDNSASSNALVGIVVKPSPARHTKDNYSTGSRALQLVVGGRLEVLRYLPVCSCATRRKPQNAASFFWKFNYLRPRCTASLACLRRPPPPLHNCGRKFEELMIILRPQRRSVVYAFRPSPPGSTLMVTRTRGIAAALRCSARHAPRHAQLIRRARHQHEQHDHAGCEQPKVTRLILRWQHQHRHCFRPEH